MRKIVNTAPPAVMVTKRQPLSVSLQIVQVDANPLTQAQDYVNGIWNPDHTTTPLVLEALFGAYDPEKEETLEVTPVVKWYLGEVKDWSSVTQTGLISIYDYETSEMAYRLQTEEEDGSHVTTGRLVVKKNVSYLKPEKVICVVEYTDVSRAETYKLEESVLLTSENKPEDFCTVTLNTPLEVRYHPITDAVSQRTFVASVRIGNTELTPSQYNDIKFFWYKKEPGDLSPVLIDTTGLFPAYVSGQGTRTLVLDADYCQQAEIIVRIADDADAASPNVSSYDKCILCWKWPRIDALPYCAAGGSVDAESTEKPFEAIVRYDGQDMPDAKRAEFIRLNWKSKPTNSSYITDRGWGDTIVIPADDLRTTGRTNVNVYTEIGVLGCLELITDDNGVLLADDSGSPTASDNHGYVVSRC